jgi:16S rRNA (uracil1498-N3)-methyltransferase
LRYKQQRVSTVHRFFIPPDRITAGRVSLTGKTARQVYSVLRLHSGARITEQDDSGLEYQVELETVERSSALGRVLESQPCTAEPQTRLTIYLGLTQREKFEYALQKCTEAGAAGFVPVITSRTLVQDSAETARKLPRWQQIVQEAAEQSGRGHLPVIHPPLRWNEALQHAVARQNHTFLLWEGEHTASVRSALADVQPGSSLAAIIGPEGGLSEAEAAVAVQAGCVPVSLGRRILRMETAALAATLLVMYQLGEMG